MTSVAVEGPGDDCNDHSTVVMVDMDKDTCCNNGQQIQNIPGKDGNIRESLQWPVYIMSIASRRSNFVIKQILSGFKMNEQVNALMNQFFASGSLG